MGVAISYMGTKRRLATVVKEIVGALPAGPMLDIFSGMCAVGEAISTDRQVWANDVQLFPSLVAKALLCSVSGPSDSLSAKPIIEPSFQRNRAALLHRFKDHLAKEARYFTSQALDDAIAGNTGLPYIGTDNRLDQERKRLARKPGTFPYRLATMTYVGSFFGVMQCIEIDSLRFAIDSALSSRSITHEQRNWFLIALGQAMSRANNSTGQFAEFLKPKEDNLNRILEKRMRSVWDDFCEALDSILPLGTAEWRALNKSFHSDALALLYRMKQGTVKPTIVYADPPYSAAQYSRYYHVLDSIVEYRYPPATGTGRYPDKRFQTTFAQSGQVSKAMNTLVRRAADLDACLVLSYPHDGLFHRQDGNLTELFRRYYAHVEVAYTGTAIHSTFGGAMAAPNVSAVENVYVGHN